MQLAITILHFSFFFSFFFSISFLVAVVVAVVVVFVVGNDGDFLLSFSVDLFI